jgi:hypothetical protein
VPNSLHALAERKIGGPEDLLALAAEAGIDVLDEMEAVAKTQLSPHLWARATNGPTLLCSTSVGSAHVPADADLTVGGLLIEPKTSLRHATPENADLDRGTMRQVIFYALHDRDDGHALTEAALYQARFGYLATWSLETLLLREDQPNRGIIAARLGWKQLVETP